MASNEVQLGGGYASGMFYTAPANTALPTYPGDDLTAWTEVGDIDADGITFTPRDSDTLKNWAGQPKRVIPGADPATVSAKIMDTTKTVLETLFGENNVSYTAASSAHGNITSVTLSPDVSADPAAYLFLVKDGDTLVSIGCEDGLITDIADVSFNPTTAVTWAPSIDGVWTISHDDGETTS